MEIEDKLKYEEDSFFCYLQLCSRATLIDRAYEISAKKAIYAKLTEELPKLSPEKRKVLSRTDDIVDFLYLHHKALIEVSDGKLTSFSWTKLSQHLGKGEGYV